MKRATALHMIAVLRRAAPADRRRKIKLLADVMDLTPTETEEIIAQPRILYRALLTTSFFASR
jgi:hypothetical protein